MEYLRETLTNNLNDLCDVLYVILRVTQKQQKYNGRGHLCSALSRDNLFHDFNIRIDSEDTQFS